MKKVIMILIALIGFNANAGLIEIEVNKSNVIEGESISVNLIASGFSEFDSFDFDFNFDNSIFAFDEFSLQSDLPMFDVFTGTFGLLASDESDHIALSFFDFMPFASSDFVLASFDLIALSSSISEFSLSDASFFSLAAPLVIDTSTTSQVTVTSATQVPEPATWLLVLMPVLLVLRKRWTIK